MTLQIESSTFFRNYHDGKEVEGFSEASFSNTFQGNSCETWGQTDNKYDNNSCSYWIDSLDMFSDGVRQKNGNCLADTH